MPNNKTFSWVYRTKNKIFNAAFGKKTATFSIVKPKGSESGNLHKLLENNLVIIDETGQVRFKHSLRDNESENSKHGLNITLINLTLDKNLLDSLSYDTLNVIIKSAKEKFQKENLSLIVNNTPRLIVIKKRAANTISLQVIFDIDSIQLNTALLKTDSQPPFLTLDTHLTIEHINNKTTATCESNYIIGYSDTSTEIKKQIIKGNPIAHKIPITNAANMQSGSNAEGVLYDAYIVKEPSIWEKTKKFIRKNPIKTGLAIIAAILFPPIAFFAVVCSIPLIAARLIPKVFDPVKKVPVENIPPYNYKLPYIEDYSEPLIKEINTTIEAISSPPQASEKTFEIVNSNKVSNPRYTPDETMLGYLKNLTDNLKNKFSLVNFKFPYIKFITSLSDINIHATRHSKYDLTNIEIIHTCLQHLDKETLTKLIDIFTSKKMLNIRHTLAELQKREPFNFEEAEADIEKENKYCAEINSVLNNIEAGLKKFPVYSTKNKTMGENKLVDAIVNHIKLEAAKLPIQKPCAELNFS